MKRMLPAVAETTGGLFTVSQYEDGAQFQRACAEREISLSGVLREYLDHNMYRFRRDAGKEVRFATFSVSELFPEFERSDPLRYRFDPFPDCVPFADLECLSDECGGDAETFMASAMKLIVHPTPKPVNIRKVTLAMIHRELYGKWCNPFSHLAVINLILNVSYPVLSQREIGEVIETDLWRRVWHKPFLVGGSQMQVCFGIGRDGQKSVELIPLNLSLGFIGQEKFLCQAI